MRRILVFASLICLTLALFITAQGTAFAATKKVAQLRFAGSGTVKVLHPLTPTCSGNGCNNTDPYATHCADNYKWVAYTRVDDSGGDAGYVYLEYSNICYTNWTQVANSGSQSVYLYAKITRASGPDGGSLTYSYSSVYNWIEVNQVYALHNQAQACGSIGNGSVNCTVWV